ncbi:MAG: hypothetical protein ACXVBW_04510, partial [Bdellovibrionota bacterium]
MRTVAGILVMLMACTSGCGLVNFSGSGSGSDLIFGKSWAPSYYVDEPLYLGNPKYSSRQLLRDFDAKALPSTLGLSATWLDPAGSFYLGYSAIYADGTGWSSPGPNFGIAAQLAGGGAGTDLGYTSLAPVSTGFEGVFFEGSGAGTVNVITDSDLANAYDSTAVKTDSGLGASVPYSGIIDLLAGTPTVTVSDANALNYTYANVGVAGYATWSATQVAAGASGASSGALATTSSLSAHFDGKEYVCGIYELNGGTLAASCVDSKTPTTTAIEVQL